MKNKNILLLCLILICVFSVNSVVNSSPNLNNARVKVENPSIENIISNKVQIINKARKVDKNLVAARVNKKNINLREVEIQTLLKNAENPTSRKDVINEFILSELYYNEAIKRGFEASTKEINDLVQETREGLEFVDNKDEFNVILEILHFANKKANNVST
jgi:hypothetical protein